MAVSDSKLRFYYDLMNHLNTKHQYPDDLMTFETTQGITIDGFIYSTVSLVWIDALKEFILKCRSQKKIFDKYKDLIQKLAPFDETAFNFIYGGEEPCERLATYLLYRGMCESTSNAILSEYIKGFVYHKISKEDLWPIDKKEYDNDDEYEKEYKLKESYDEKYESISEEYKNFFSSLIGDQSMLNVAKSLSYETFIMEWSIFEDSFVALTNPMMKWYGLDHKKYIPISTRIDCFFGKYEKGKEKIKVVYDPNNPFYVRDIEYTYKLLMFCAHYRNTMHNNGIAQEDEELILNGYRYEIKKGDVFKLPIDRPIMIELISKLYDIDFTLMMALTFALCEISGEIERGGIVPDKECIYERIFARWLQPIKK